MVTWKYEICFEELQAAMLCYPMVIFTLVKITCFSLVEISLLPAKARLVFHSCLYKNHI